MLIEGRWLLCDDGIVRPVISGRIRGNDAAWEKAEFLVDVGADRTVIAADILLALNLSNQPSTMGLGGVGGRVETVIIDTQISLPGDKGPAIFKGSFAAFTDPKALDMSVLGRDITNLFAVIVDRPGDRICLVGQQHRYRIETV